MNGGYDLQGVIWHQHSNRLLIKMMELLPKETPVIDIGCGHNFYISAMIYAGYRGIGVDMVDLGSKYFEKGDVTDPNTFKLRSDKKMNVISLEVGEHIPADKSAGYLDNVCSFGGDVIMSWAVQGQAGHGHINCQPNEWVLDEMWKRKYMLRFDKTNELRESVKDCHCSWFKNTLMYFQPEYEKI